MGRGVTVGADGIIWVAQHGGWSNGRLTGYNSETLEIAESTDEANTIVHDLYLGSRGNIPIGVGIGSGGKIWTNNQSSQNLTAYDPRTGAYGFYPLRMLRQVKTKVEPLHLQRLHREPGQDVHRPRRAVP